MYPPAALHLKVPMWGPDTRFPVHIIDDDDLAICGAGRMRHVKGLGDEGGFGIRRCDDCLSVRDVVK